MLEGISNGISSILDFFKNLFLNLFNFIYKLFIPEQDYWSSNYNILKENFLNKFKFIEQLDNVFNFLTINTLSEDVYYINFPSYNLNIDFSWYEPYRLKFRNILIGAFTLIFIGTIVKRNDPKINMGG